MALNWSVVAVVHSLDNYGLSGSAEFKRLAAESHICVILTTSIGDGSSSVVESLSEKLIETESAFLGVVFFGQAAEGKELLHLANQAYKRRSLEFKFIMSDSIGIDSTIVSEFDNVAPGLISITPAYNIIHEFKNHWISLFGDMNKVKERTKHDPWIEEYHMMTHKCQIKGHPLLLTVPFKNFNVQCSSLTRTNIANAYDQHVYLETAIDIAYTIGHATKEVHKKTCGRERGPCKAFIDLHSNYFFEFISQVNFSYGSHIPYLPKEILLSKKHIQFENGELIKEGNAPVYVINNLQKMGETYAWKKVGHYTNNAVHIDHTKLKFYKEGKEYTSTSYSKSVCKLRCKSCIKDDKDTKFVYIDGDFIIGGLFPIHGVHKENAFLCGDFRETAGYELSEAFAFAIDQLNKNGIPGSSIKIKWGGLVLDSCYNYLYINDILSDFLSGKQRIISGGKVINTEHIGGFVGPLGSSIASSVSSILTKLGMLQVGFGSTSTSLGDKLQYPFYLRTCPPDDQQAKAMIALIKRMGWSYISIVHRDNAYGINGMKSLRHFAKENSICVAQSLSISPTSKLSPVIEALQRKHAARVVILFVDALMARDFLQAIITAGASDQFLFIGTESWANRKDLIQYADEKGETHKLGMASKGAFTLMMTTQVNQDFDEYLTRHCPSNYDRNPWQITFWENEQKCKLPFTFNSKYSKTCDPMAKLNTSKKGQDPLVQFVIKAVYGLAYGISKAIEDLCPENRNTLCDKARKNPSVIYDKVIKAKLVDGASEKDIFNPEGYGSSGYDILNVQEDRESSLGYRYTKVSLLNVYRGYMFSTSFNSNQYCITG